MRPPYLRQGDTVAIVSPSGPIHADSLDFAIQTLESWGLQVCVGSHAFDSFGVFAGTDEHRAADFQSMIDDDSIRAIICARGGYGAIRTIDFIDFSHLISSPKWIVGFSDITMFHARMQSLDIQSIHGVMAKGFPSVTDDSLRSLHDALFGINHSVSIPYNTKNRLGLCHGKLIGGNLSMLYSMRGIDYEYDYRDAILFIEDLNEYYYHIDRMMQNLKHSGILSSISGLIVGTMSGMKNGTDVFSGSIEDIVLDAVGDCSYPILFDFPAGHESNNEALIIGGEYEMGCDESSSQVRLLMEI